jgi:lipid-A-disaccharide synthase
MLEAARDLNAVGPLAALEPARDGLQFIVPLASTLNTAQRAEVRILVEELKSGLDIHLVDDVRAALFHARASVVASGTATVEAALIGNPFVVVYRVSPVTYAIAKRVVTVAHVAMANLIAGKRVVTELIQDDFTASNIVKEIAPLLPDGPRRQSMILGRRAAGKRAAPSAGWRKSPSKSLERLPRRSWKKLCNRERYGVPGL